MQNNIFYTNKNLQIVDSQYFGCINYYNSLFNYSNTEIEQFDNFQKMSFRNRCTIAGSNGLIDLTVPVVGGRNKRQLMKDVKIDYSQGWQKQHIKTINSCYGKSPFYEYYKDSIEKLLKCQYFFLIDLNMEILIWLKKMLQVPNDISFTRTYLIYDEKEKIINNRNKYLPNNFQSQEISINYSQVFEEKIGFQSNLSILDMLFCEGPNAKNLLNINYLF